MITSICISFTARKDAVPERNSVRLAETLFGFEERGASAKLVFRSFHDKCQTISTLTTVIVGRNQGLGLYSAIHIIDAKEPIVSLRCRLKDLVRSK